MMQSDFCPALPPPPPPPPPSYWWFLCLFGGHPLACILMVLLYLQIILVSFGFCRSMPLVNLSSTSTANIWKILMKISTDSSSTTPRRWCQPLTWLSTRCFLIVFPMHRWNTRFKCAPSAWIRLQTCDHSILKVNPCWIFVFVYWCKMVEPITGCTLGGQLCTLDLLACQVRVLIGG